MTDNSGNFWGKRQGTHMQLPVNNPPNGQNANNARMAVWHLGRPFTLEVFPEGGWQVGDIDDKDDGRYDRGDSFEITVYGHIQPLTYNNRDGSQDLGTRRGGEYVEGEIVVHLDSHQPENLEAAAASTFFDDYVYLSPSESMEGHRNFSMLVHWRGRRWKMRTVQEHAEASDEEVSGLSGAVYRAVCQEFTDVNQEKLAVPADQIVYYGPDSP